MLLDAGQSLGDGLRALKNVQTEHPGLPVVLVAEDPTQRALQRPHLRQVERDGEAIDAVEVALSGSTSLQD